MSESNLKPGEDAVLAKWVPEMDATIETTISVMRTCPYESREERVASILGILGHMVADDRLMPLIAAVAIERVTPLPRRGDRS